MLSMKSRSTRAEHLAVMKVPRYIVFVDERSYSASRRVAKFHLNEDTTLRAARTSCSGNADLRGLLGSAKGR
jgi:hypothetical protein